MAPATSTGLGLAQARAVDGHPAPPPPKQGTQQHLFPMGQVGATAVGWCAGGGGASPHGQWDASCCLQTWE